MVIRVLASLAIIRAAVADLTVPGCECPLSACCDWLAAGKDADAIPISCLLALQPPKIDLAAICDGVADGTRDDGALSVCDTPEVMNGPLTGMTIKRNDGPCAPRECHFVEDPYMDYNIEMAQPPDTHCTTHCGGGMCSAISYACDGDAIPMNIIANQDNFDVDDPLTDKKCPPPHGTVGPNLPFGPQTEAVAGEPGAMGACTTVEDDEGQVIGTIVSTITGRFPCTATTESPSAKPTPAPVAAPTVSPTARPTSRDSKKKKDGIAPAAVAGVVIACLLALGCLLAVLYMMCRPDEEEDTWEAAEKNPVPAVAADDKTVMSGATDDTADSGPAIAVTEKTAVAVDAEPDEADAILQKLQAGEP